LADDFNWVTLPFPSKSSCYVAWYSHYSYYAGGKDKSKQLTLGKSLLYILIAIVLIFLFMVVVGSLQ